MFDETDVAIRGQGSSKGFERTNSEDVSDLDQSARALAVISSPGGSGLGGQGLCFGS